MADFREVADRVWVARYAAHDVNVTVVGGERGSVVVDTRESVAAGEELRADVARLGTTPVRWVVNTHDHFDHVGGNSVFAPAEVVAHEAADVPDVALRLSSVRALDLGDRSVELVHPGRGHTAGDLLVMVPDAHVLLAGDLVEQSAPPSYGDDSWPMEWPLALDMVLSLTTSRSVVVPGHGSPVDRDFVEEQRHQLGTVAETVRDLAGRGVPLSEALGAAPWPFPDDVVAPALRRGYAQLPRTPRHLPLV